MATDARLEPAASNSVFVEANGVAELRSAGMEVITDVDRTKFQEALEPAYAEYSKKFGK